MTEQQKGRKNGYVRWGGVAVLVVASFMIGRAMSAGSAVPGNANGQYSEKRGRGVFTNPLLECDQAEGAFTELVPFKYKVEQEASRQKEDGEVKTIAVYFRDLNNGPWFGINEQIEFSPASLLKVPVLMAYLKYAETDPSILTKHIVFNEKEMARFITPNFIEAEPLKDGESYSVEALLERMIEYSDNESLALLSGVLEGSFVDKVYSDLGIIIPKVRDKDDFMTVKSYASFLRILFNASYINKSLSEKGLEIMTQSKFTKGLVAGVPPSVKIAHKFGVRTVAGTDVKQLHDCGIVYYPNHPYILCIMTRGKDLDRLASAIADMSKFVFKEVDSQYQLLSKE